MAKTKKTSKTRQKFDFGMENKNKKHFMLHMLLESLLLHSVCCCSLPV